MTRRAERVVEVLQHRIQIEASQITIQKADEPDIVMNVLDIGRLADEDGAES